ncbi:competence protein ComK [Cytobacillus sp. Sa5YUA1]|uniref:Competence protein ComK n=1 Tax=Cytobacillus stercorigallinarum TaxID=2762240 RepID=A0ABR8QSG6_9BACI|nr:competence protein ComK [Cytobacillus stercorigallinarum]MBD7938354.1 competence protein ComK [Cytobacillus stercorigallinarum]
METCTNYIINESTATLKAERVQNNYIHTKVIEGRNRVFNVAKPPIAIVKESLKEYGMTYQGALQAAKYKLDKKSTPPFRICGAKDMYWFYFSSQKNLENTFVSLAHILDIQPDNKKQTKIILTSGYYFYHPISYKVANGRKNQAILLRGRIEDSIKKQSSVHLIELPEKVSEEKEE